MTLYSVTFSNQHLPFFFETVLNSQDWKMTEIVGDLNGLESLRSYINNYDYGYCGSGMINASV